MIAVNESLFECFAYNRQTTLYLTICDTNFVYLCIWQELIWDYSHRWSAITHSSLSGVKEIETDGGRKSWLSWHILSHYLCDSSVRLKCDNKYGFFKIELRFTTVLIFGQTHEQKLRNCPNSRYSSIVKFERNCENWSGRVRIHNNDVLSDSELLLDCHLRVFKMSSKIPLWRCSLNVFAIVIVFLIVFLLVRSCYLITLIKYLISQKSQRPLFEGSKCICHCHCHCLCLCLCLCGCLFVGQVMFSHQFPTSHQFCEVGVWSVRLECFESRTMKMNRKLAWKA